MAKIGKTSAIKSIPLSTTESTYTVNDMSRFREIKLVIFQGDTNTTLPMVECTISYELFKSCGGIMCRSVTSSSAVEYARVIYNSDTSITARGCNTTNKCVIYGVY